MPEHRNVAVVVCDGKHGPFELPALPCGSFGLAPSYDNLAVVFESRMTDTARLLHWQR